MACCSKCSLVFCLLFASTLWGGELITHRVESKLLAESDIGVNTSQDLLVYLPDDYATGDKTYPVAYWFPGAGQQTHANINFEALEREFQSGRSAETIVVMMPSKEWFGSSAYLSSPEFGDWEGFLLQEAIPSIESTFRVAATQDKRGIMGFSQGGFTSLMMPMLHPGVFGASASNDPAFLTIPSFVRDGDEVPEGVELPDRTPEESRQAIMDFFDQFPDTIEGYAEVPSVFRLYGQIGLRLTPNPDAALRIDFPITTDVTWDADARAVWRSYDLLDPNTVEARRDTLEDLATVTIILPEAESATSVPWNRELIRVLDEAGLPAQGISMPGDHNDNQHDRFRTLLSNVSYALQDESRAILTTEGFQQNFNALGTDDTVGVDLPVGWSVTDKHQDIFRNSTNTAFNSGEVELIGIQPYILNTGAPQAEDRSLSVHLDSESESTIQYLADVTNLDANALQLSFDMEVWDYLATVEETAPETNGTDDANVVAMADNGMPESVSLALVAEADFGDGFEQIVDFGIVSTDQTQSR